MKEERYSIIVPNFKRCYVCGTDRDIHIHEVFFGSSNRKKSIKWGLCVPLCGAHHNLSNQGVHFNKQLDERLKKQAEKIWIKTYCDSELSNEDKIEAFIKEFGRNYLDEEEL